MQLVTLFPVTSYVQPSMQTVLQIFLGEKLQVLLGRSHVRSYGHLAFAPFNIHNPSTKTSSFSIHFDS